MRVAVQGEPRESGLRRGENRVEAEGAPEVRPHQCIRGFDGHGQPEVPQGLQDGLERGMFEEGKVGNTQVVQGEGRQVRRRTEAEAGRESGKDARLRREAIPAARIEPVSALRVELQVNGFKLGQLVHETK